METPVLEGKFVRLEPLREEHLPALARIAFDQNIWKYMIVTMKTPDDLRHWAQEGWDAEAAGTMLPWITMAKQPDGSTEVAGGTRLMDVNLTHRTAEVGNSWIAEPWRGTRVNTEAKFLQLRYAFETLELERIALKAHAKNLRSQAAIRAIGAQYEGTFRNHMLMPDGSYRDSAWFSIIRSEWPAVKDMLQRRLRAPL
jgi:RimJ/RimL family protein N-acetyltransferase